MTLPLEPAAAVVGAGPAGLAAAEVLARRGTGPVLVIERDDAPGGLPRFCGHPGFGWAFTRRIESGPAFARRMATRAEAAGARILCCTTVIALEPGPALRIVGPGTGPVRLTPRAVVLATGIRERPRGARLVPGTRPERGVYTTGQLQQMESRGVAPAGRTLVVVGSEHVAFSALLTAGRLGLRVVAMVEPGARVLSHTAAGWAARLFGVPVLTRTRIAEIEGRGSGCVDAVIVEGPDGRRRIPCEGVVFTGDWVPEAMLAREADLEWDERSAGPVIDQAMRTSLPGVFAAGNMLRGVETSGIATREGARAGAYAAAWLGGEFGPWRPGPRIALAPEFRYLVPQRWSSGLVEPPDAWRLAPTLRMNADYAQGRVVLKGGTELWRGRNGPHRRERRVRLDLSPLERCPEGCSPAVVFSADSS